MTDLPSLSLKIKAKVYTARERDGGYQCFMNVSINDVMFINSVAVMPNRLDNNGLYIIFPRNHNNGKKGFFEFPNRDKNPLYKAIEKALSSAYATYERKQMPHYYGETVLVNIKDINSFVPKKSSDFEETEFPSEQELEDALNGKWMYGNSNENIKPEDIPF